jgi:hypothetical protein
MMDFIFTPGRRWTSYRKEVRVAADPFVRRTASDSVDVVSFVVPLPDECVRGYASDAELAQSNLFNSFRITSTTYKQFQRLAGNFALEAIQGLPNRRTTFESSETA